MCCTGRGRRLGGESEWMRQDEREAPPLTLDAGEVGLQPLLSGGRVIGW